MSLNIRLKHSTTKDKQPDKSDLVAGELAININSDSPAGYALNTDNPPAVQQMFGPATTGQAGQAEIATQNEVDLGADLKRIVTPGTLGQRLVDYKAAVVDAGIAAEAAARTSADTTLQNNLAKETQDRIAGDQQNATDIASLTTDVASRVDKAGDTMTGDLTVPNLNATNGNYTGDIGAVNGAYSGDISVTGVIDNSRMTRHWGEVNSNGTKRTGTMASSSRTAKGIYQVTFAPPLPTGTYTVVTGVTDASMGFVICNTSTHTVNGFEIRTASATAVALEDRDFSFAVYYG